MNTWAAPGVKCVCINDDPNAFDAPSTHSGNMGGLRKSEIYTVREVGISPRWGTLCVWLNEVKRPHDNGLNLRRFRPLAYPSQFLEADLSRFKPLLAPTELESA